MLLLVLAVITSGANNILNLVATDCSTVVGGARFERG